MSKSNYAQKYALMCLRFSTECIKLAADAPTSELRAHFLRMASRWAKLADQPVSRHWGEIASD